MYVEDNPANISLLQRIARMGGHEVINYTNGEHALNNFAADSPDLVLMDLQLEGRVSGLEVVRKLRERGFKTPIVAVTAYAMVGDRERCIEAGCDSYLSKPLPVAELVELVQTYERKAQGVPATTPPAGATAQAEVETATALPKPNAVVDTQEVDVLKAVAEVEAEAQAKTETTPSAAPSENS
jgi:two-component system cell cycle response regulator DivK